MTKLTEWMLIGTVIFGFWLAVVTEKASLPVGCEWLGLWFPLIFIISFGLYAMVIVLYRVFTFNNCESAAIELQKQIKEARADLESKGIVMRNKSL